MVDTTIPRNAPGIASFASESIGGNAEARFGDGAAPTQTANVPESTTFELYEVVAKNSAGDLVAAVYGASSGVATGELTFSGVGTADDTITIGTTVYTLKAAPAAAYEVKIGASAAATAANMISAINADADAITAGDVGPDTVAHPSVSAAEGSTTAKVLVTAFVSGDEANAVATTETGTNTAWGAATLTGGDDDVQLKPFGITTAPVVTASGQRTTIDVYRGGHWDIDQLVWDDSFDTDAKKLAAFEGSLSPMILLSKKKFGLDAIDV